MSFAVCFIMRALLAFLFILSPALAPAATCFQDHLTRAMALNRQRMPLYSVLSDSRSESVSADLIRMEGFMLTTSKWIEPYDKMAAPFEEAGVHVVCDSYVSMDLVPQFATLHQKAATEQPRWSPGSLNFAFLKGDFAEIKKAALNDIQKLSADKASNCLSRHFLESIARIAALAPVHAAKAQAQGLPSPTRIHKKMIFGHLALMKMAMDIDRKAFPIQQAGVPILCQDIPPIAIP